MFGDDEILHLRHSSQVSPGSAVRWRYFDKSLHDYVDVARNFNEKKYFLVSLGDDSVAVKATILMQWKGKKKCFFALFLFFFVMSRFKLKVSFCGLIVQETLKNIVEKNH